MYSLGVHDGLRACSYLLNVKLNKKMSQETYRNTRAYTYRNTHAYTYRNARAYARTPMIDTLKVSFTKCALDLHNGFVSVGKDVKRNLQKRPTEIPVCTVADV